MPGWVHSELSKLIFKFFWKGKPDLVARVVVTQPTAAGGFSVVDIKSKVFSLLVQWVRRFSSSPSGWVSFFSYWCSVLLGKPASDVFACPSAFSTNFFPPFYRDLLVAWKEVDGSFSERRSSLIFASSSPHHVAAVSCMTSKCVYSFLMSESRGDPHCVEKFLPLYGVLYWPTTWRQLFFFDLDRPVIDLCWKIAHGVLFTADRLIGFGYSIDPSCFCGLASECLPHLFFSCPLAQSALSWLQSLMFRFSSLSPSLVCRHVLFGFSPDEVRSIPRIFVYMLNVCKFSIWKVRNDFRFRDVPPGACVVIEMVKSRVRFFLPLLFKRFKSPRRRRLFHRQWGASGVIGSVVDSRFFLSL
ncbi:uncharacterized protein [Acropora muricata]|uniref:uncharacterized protein n=1 Tax=Acropora muricata TaxID=159855 RepID=UPI0034E378F6